MDPLAFIRGGMPPGGDATPFVHEKVGRSRRRTVWLALITAWWVLPPAAFAAERLVFNQHVKPILSEACYACHGPDPGTRKAGLRLDTQEGLFESSDKRRAAVVAGDPERSELWNRLITEDADDLMPPPKSHKTLTAEQKQRIRQWILDGAVWQPHWAFLKPQRPAVPTAPLARGRVSNPIDAFVLQRLHGLDLAQAPEADRRTLARRVSLDLTGLPPAPEEVEAFAQDDAPDAYQRLVRRLLNSPRWGEHRARTWLDAARYADTHGLHFDNYREMWPYRDWVIRAFNRNLPFDQFTIDQIAGDLLPEATEDQLIATGFQRCNATTNEGGTIEAENLVNYANDRVTTLGWVWLGLTANCAACHDHKFDPLTMRDFYGLAAFFRNTTQSGFDGNLKDGANASLTVIADPEVRARFNELPGLIAGAKTAVDDRKMNAKPAFQDWASTLTMADVETSLVRDLDLHLPLREGAGETLTGTGPEGQHRTFSLEGPGRWADNGARGNAVHFDRDANVPLGDLGDFELGQPFSFGGWVYVPSGLDGTASILARMDEANSHRGWDLWIQQSQFAMHLVSSWPEDAVKVRTRQKLARKGDWQHVFVTVDGSGKASGIRIFVDGLAVETDSEAKPQVRESIRTATPLRLGRRSTGSAFAGGAIQEFRLYRRVLAGPEVRALARADELRQLLATPRSEWPKPASDEVFDYFLHTHAPYLQATKTLAALEKERDGIRSRHPVTHVQREKTNSVPMAAVLFRGQYDQPRTNVTAAVPGVLHAFPEGAPTNRLGLAKWLVDPANPLTARVTVNRFWQEIFGVGLVRSSEDFGIMGDAPSHPELLDWLAVEFEASGWNVKHLFELMVTSATYRQSVASAPTKLEKDPANRWLSRGPRFRMDAEMVRDYAIAVSGKLDPAVGGASVKPYQPPGVWEAVAMPESNTRQYRRDSGTALYRRSLYTFWKRSAPPALLDVFNAPSRESCTVRRERTNTPLQALATLNDETFIEAARVLAEAALDVAPNLDAALHHVARRVLCRPLHPEELHEVTATLQDALDFYRSQPEQAQKLTAVGASSSARRVDDGPRLAALTVVANQLLNLDETLTK